MKYSTDVMQNIIINKTAYISICITCIITSVKFFRLNYIYKKLQSRLKYYYQLS